MKTDQKHDTGFYVHADDGRMIAHVFKENGKDVRVEFTARALTLTELREVLEVVAK